MPDDEPKVKRSRFDQTEPEPRKASRFDRRSRSPPSRSTDVGRSRSPMGHHSRSPAPSDQTSTSQDPTAAAGMASPAFCRSSSSSNLPFPLSAAIVFEAHELPMLT